MSDTCEIVVKGQLDADWSGWFEGLTITHTTRGETVVAGPIRDQTALYSILAKMCDLGLYLISVRYTADEASQGKDARMITRSVQTSPLIHARVAGGLWLLAKGVNTQRWKEHASISRLSYRMDQGWIRQ